MLEINKLKEHSFLVYGLGLSGCSVVNFFKKKGITNFSVWDDKQKKLYIMNDINTVPPKQKRRF